MSYKLLYISNARLPTEQAHGYQIGKMCEAFAHHKVKVTLYHPKRYQPNPELEETSIFDYYGLSNCFELKTLPNIDLLSLNDKLKLPSKISPYLIVLNYLSWGLYAVLEAKKEKADIYFTRDVSVAFWLTKFGLPTVLELHSINKKINKWLLKQVIKNSALKLFVVLTSFLKKELIELGGKSEKIHIAPDSVDLSLFENLPTKEECRQKLGLPQDKIIIGYLGRFRTMNMEKGIPELLQAVGKLPDNQKKEPLLLCVGGPMDAVQDYINIASKYNISPERFMFHDRVSNTEIPYWLKSFDLALAPFPNINHYAYYMSPLKIFEYMAAQIPIITTDLPSIKEILKHSENAWLVKPGEVEALVSGIQTLILDEDKSQLLVKNAAQEVTKYTWYNRAKLIIQNCQNLI